MVLGGGAVFTRARYQCSLEASHLEANKRRSQNLAAVRSLKCAPDSFRWNGGRQAGHGAPRLLEWSEVVDIRMNEEGKLRAADRVTIQEPLFQTVPLLLIISGRVR